MFLNRSHEVTIFEKTPFSILAFTFGFVDYRIVKYKKLYVCQSPFLFLLPIFLVYACLFAPQLRMSHFHQNPFVTKQKSFTVTIDSLAILSFCCDRM